MLPNFENTLGQKNGWLVRAKNFHALRKHRLLQCSPKCQDYWDRQRKMIPDEGADAELGNRIRLRKGTAGKTSRLVFLPPDKS
jgi:hypothetical protein